MEASVISSDGSIGKYLLKKYYAKYSYHTPIYPYLLREIKTKLTDIIKTIVLQKRQLDFLIRSLALIDI